MASSDLQVVVGLGATGIACIEHLRRQGATVAVIDTRSAPPQLAAVQERFPEVQVYLGGLHPDVLRQAGRIILSPGVPWRREAIFADCQQQGIPIVGDIELFAQAVAQPVIAITGTNAKSTVTTLVGKMAAAAGYHVQVGGNLGVPALDLIHQDPRTNLFVLEISSFQLETTHTLAPRVATVLNVTPDHMDRYDDLRDYQRTKQRIYQGAHTAVCNRDDPLTVCGTATPDQIFYFTMNAPRHNEFGLCQQGGETYLCFEDQCLLAINELPVLGKHYHANALAALALGHAFGLPFAPMLQVLREFPGLPHRCELTRVRAGVRWYNDSKGTNVGATLAAIEGLGSEINGKLVLIAGGVGKNADFTPLLPAIEQYVRHVVLIGEAASELSQLLAQRVDVSLANSMQEAIQHCADAAQPEDSVLLSPACASFDMFKNFEHRGEVFTSLVQEMP